MNDSFPAVVNQYYDPGLMDKEYVMRGNAAILKCSIPSFVADFVYVVAWVDEEGTEIVASEDFDASKLLEHRIRDNPFILYHFP